jgi:vacuolar-type H+-ATPase subunit H
MIDGTTPGPRGFAGRKAAAASEYVKVKDRTGGDRSETVYRAMDRVLEAESEAQASIEACRLEASLILSKARNEARRSSEHAQSRIRRVRKVCDAGTADRIQAICQDAEAERATEDSVTGETELIRNAARRLAERLTTPDGCE